ncbi:uncharacterized protein LOC109258414 [Panthera pardus]|uniref:Uncharacterized protein LOC109258414 n=1 Tax=Panthera pardus TaxID=9691 RepID=A0A9W2V1U1_PANPR|nr:uncharacterized protein LOC109258414 [Panthera pardus]XP_053752322.1 uncharacterized protein LOC109258414 [Panthera pardus]XP_053752323.1 uncharacterized protein LOC109258414 [Panthera pardus]
MGPLSGLALPPPPPPDLASVSPQACPCPGTPSSWNLCCRYPGNFPSENVGWGGRADRPGQAADALWVEGLARPTPQHGLPALHILISSSTLRPGQCLLCGTPRAPPSGQAVLSAPREFPDRVPHLAPGPLPLPPLLLRPPGGRGGGLSVLTPCSRICLLPKRRCLCRASQRLMAEDGEARGPERPWSRLRAASGPSQGHLGPGSGAEPGSSWAGTVTATRWDSEMASPPWWQPGLARWPSSHTESGPDLQAASHPSLPTRQKFVANHGCGHRHSQDLSSRLPLGSGTGYVLFQDVPSPCAFELVLPGHPFLRPHLP